MIPPCPLRPAGGVRKPRASGDDPIRRLDAEGVPKTLIAARTGLSRAAVYRVLDGTYTPDD